MKQMLSVRHKTPSVIIDIMPRARCMRLRDTKKGECTFAYTRRKAFLVLLIMQDRKMPEALIDKWHRHIDIIWPEAKS